MTKISFSNRQADFTIALKKSVEEYFASRKLTTTGNWKLYSKTIVLLTSAVATYLLLLMVAMPGWLSLVLCVLFGFNLAAIGFNVMHDGAHGSYSRKGWVNEMMGYTLNLMGGNVLLWKTKHNMIHHSFTNIEGVDDDIDIRPFIRTNVNQPHKWFHRAQHIYFPLLYSLTHFWWIYQRDFLKYFSGKISGMKIKKLTISEHFIFWISKLVYFFIFLALPLMALGPQALIGYTLATVVSGITISIVFQLAHVVEHADFPVPDANSNKIEESWTIHQLNTTANFSTSSRIITWFTGGLNFQVEHHLFPRISHVHYPALQKMVKSLCRQYNVQYIEYPTMFRAIRSHVSYLREVGRR
ncbi:MAG TPA: fatty acid desaturase [Bacteroidia bacterium]|nr:fatty acid desaturase [Bacteroidia bacterium]